MTSRPTLRDVARRTGYSTAAVSLALRNSPRLPEATRTVIRAAAAALGYRADPMLAALAAHRWQGRGTAPGATLAALADGTLEGHAGMAARAAAYGYRFEVFQIRDYPDPARLASVLEHRGILGLIVGQIFTPGFCAAFDWSRFVAVACSEGFERPPVHLVMPNHYKAVQEAWDRTWQRGYRRIGLALFDQPSAIDYHDRCAAFLERQQIIPVARRLPVAGFRPVREAARDAATERMVHGKGVEALRRWLRRHRPDAILGFSDSFRWLLEEAGWRSEEAAFISVWIFDARSTSIGMRLTHAEVGRRAVDWLNSLVRAGERGIPEHPVTMSIDMRWQDGAPG